MSSYTLCVALENRVSAQQLGGRSRCIGTRICKCEAHLPAADSELSEDLEQALAASGTLGSFADLDISSFVQPAYQLCPERITIHVLPRIRGKSFRDSGQGIGWPAKGGCGSQDHLSNAGAFRGR